MLQLLNAPKVGVSLAGPVRCPTRGYEEFDQKW